jgi:hypothetical protein
MRPIGLLLLARDLFCGPRQVLFSIPGSNDYRVVIKRRSWLMGDPMTKLLLSIA